MIPTEEDRSAPRKPYLSTTSSTTNLPVPGGTSRNCDIALKEEFHVPDILQVNSYLTVNTHRLHCKDRSLGN